MEGDQDASFVGRRINRVVQVRSIVIRLPNVEFLQVRLRRSFGLSYCKNATLR